MNLLLLNQVCVPVLFCINLLSAIILALLTNLAPSVLQVQLAPPDTPHFLPFLIITVVPLIPIWMQTAKAFCPDLHIGM